jgi:hypothetical protein
MPQAAALQAIFNVSQQSTLELIDHATISRGDPIITGALIAARPFARRRRKAYVEGPARNLQLARVQPPHTRLIRRRERRSACG